MKIKTHLLVALILLVLSGGGYFWYGFVNIQRGNAFSGEAPDVALAAYQRALAVFPWQDDLYEKAGFAALDALNAHTALGLLLEARSRDALSAQGQAALGQAYYQLGQVDDAIREWQALDGSGQADGAVYRSLATVYHIRGQYELESQAIQKGLSIQPDDADLTLRSALLLMSSSPLDALPGLQRASQLHPDLASRLTEADSALKNALADANPAYPLTVSGQLLGGLGEWGLAVRALENAIAVDPQYSPAWAWLGEARQQAGQDGALDALHKAVELMPLLASNHAMLGMYWQRNEEFLLARVQFETAVQLEPDNAYWQVALADLYDRTNNLNAALNHYQRATELAPTDPTIWRTLALYCLSKEMFIREMAHPAALKAYRLAPDDAQNMDVVGRTLLSIGDLQQAERLLKKAVDAAPESPSPAFHLGLLYLQTGDNLLAEHYLQLAQSLDPDGPVGEQAARVLARYFP